MIKIQKKLIIGNLKGTDINYLIIQEQIRINNSNLNNYYELITETFIPEEKIENKKIIDKSLLTIEEIENGIILTNKVRLLELFLNINKKTEIIKVRNKSNKKA